MKHPLTDVFNMDDEIDISQQFGAPAVVEPTAISSQQPEKDEEDIEVEKKIDNVYDAAMAAFNNQTAYIEVIEPRYAARNAEVAANYLNIALSAANSRAKVKVDRKRANASFVPYGPGGKTTNNMIFANREDILKMITIDNQQTEVK